MEADLRKLKVWTKFKANVKLDGDNTLEEALREPTVDHCFFFSLSPEGFDFWADINHKMEGLQDE